MFEHLTVSVSSSGADLMEELAQLEQGMFHLGSIALGALSPLVDLKNENCTQVSDAAFQTYGRLTATDCSNCLAVSRHVPF